MSDMEPMFSCSDPDCRVEVSYPAHMLALFEGGPICENCYSENPPFDPVDWSALPKFVPPYADEIAALRKRVEVLEGALHKIHRTANGNRKDKAFRIAQIVAQALQDKPNG